MISEGGGNFSFGLKNEGPNTLPSVALKLENITEIEKCKKIKIGDVFLTDYNCYIKNVVECQSISYYSGTVFRAPVDHFLKGPQDEFRKIGVWMITQKNTFYIQFAYKIHPHATHEACYKILKLVGDKYEVIKTNLDDTSENKQNWNLLFPEPIQIRTTKQ